MRPDATKPALRSPVIPVRGVGQDVPTLDY